MLYFGEMGIFAYFLWNNVHFCIQIAFEYLSFPIVARRQWRRYSFLRHFSTYSWLHLWNDSSVHMPIWKAFLQILLPCFHSFRRCSLRIRSSSRFIDLFDSVFVFDELLADWNNAVAVARCKWLDFNFAESLQRLQIPEQIIAEYFLYNWIYELDFLEELCIELWMHFPCDSLRIIHFQIRYWYPRIVFFN